MNPDDLIARWYQAGCPDFEIEYTPPRLAIEDLIMDEYLDSLPVTDEDSLVQLGLFEVEL